MNFILPLNGSQKYLCVLYTSAYYSRDCMVDVVMCDS